MKLVLQNKTEWSTRDLRKFLIAGMQAKGVHHRVVEVIHGRQNAHHGIAWVNTDHLRLSLPGPSAVKHGAKVDYLKLAQVFEHEIDHTLGLTHKDMLDWWLLRPTWHEGLTIAWCGQDKLAMDPSQRAAALSATIEQRRQHARRMLQRAETRLKRARTIQQKWSKKVAYYERVK